MEKVFERPNFAATMMAAVPYRDMEKAEDVIMKRFPEAPSLPVMTRGIKWMLEGIPCVVIDREKRRILLDPSPEREDEILEFYTKYVEEDLDYFATTPETAPFFYGMLERLKKERPPALKWVIFHTAGPLLLGDSIKQPDGNPSIHHETLRDVLIKGTNMKARWLEKKIKEEIPDVEVVADLSETTLVNFTSAGGTGSREDVIGAINEGFSGMACLTWIHCCANIDWSLLTDTTVNVINFDAYQHAGKAELYAEDFKRFLDRGGMIGWGIVPVIGELLSGETVSSLVDRLQEGMDGFISKGIDETLLASASWVIPCCETVLLTPEESDLALSMTQEISQVMKRRYGFD